MVKKNLYAVYVTAFTPKRKKEISVSGRTFYTTSKKEALKQAKADKRTKYRVNFHNNKIVRVPKNYKLKYRAIKIKTR